MPVVARLRQLLDRHGASHQVLAPSSLQDPARAMREVARVVVIRHGATRSLAVLPARSGVALDRLSAALRTRVELAPDSEIAAAFTDCAPGAIPPFGALYGLRTYVDESLTHDRHIVFAAGTHGEVVRMTFEDYRRIAALVVLWFAESLARAGS